jgi:GNAT superfamily N-acetyltransferase
MGIVIREAKSTSEILEFIKFASVLYRNNPYWVPFPFSAEFDLLRSNHNPAFDNCEARYFLAYRDNRIVGRVAAILNHEHLRKWGQQYMRFGWMEFVDDREVSSALMHTVENWARELGLKAIHGPLGFTDFDRSGFLVEGFQEMGTLAAGYTMPFYPQHMEDLGYHKDIDWLEYEIVVPEKVDPAIAERSDYILKSNDLHLLQPRHKSDLLPYAKSVFDVVNEAYRDTYAVVPFNEKVSSSYIKHYYLFLKPDFVPIILDRHDKVVAFSVCFPSFSKALQQGGGKISAKSFVNVVKSTRVNDRADLYLHGVSDAYSGKGLSVVLMKTLIESFNRHGIKKVESNPELETNRSIQVQWNAFEKRQHKRRRIYIRELAD